jgi:hypothetical protein
MKKLLFFLLIVAGCSDDTIDKTMQTKYEIAPLFQKEVAEFYLQAEAHGNAVANKENLILKVMDPDYVDSNGVYVLGRSYTDGDQRIVEVRDVPPCLEFPVFREMAHVFLNKPYATTGEVIMNPDANPCAYIQVSTGAVYTEVRKAYLTELFK